jgi:hypothetical protein
MSKELNVTQGLHIKTSLWGSAKVNGITARNCIRVKEYEYGYVFEVMWLLGAGKLWLAKDGLQIGEIHKGSFFRPLSLKLIYKKDKVTVYGKLTQAFINPAT